MCVCFYFERPANSFTHSCQNHGVYDATSMTCHCDNTYSGFDCQFKGLSSAILAVIIPLKHASVSQSIHFAVHCKKTLVFILCKWHYRPISSISVSASVYGMCVCLYLIVGLLKATETSFVEAGTLS